MSVYTQNQKYKDVLKDLEADGFSDAIFAADFKTIKVTLDTGTSSDFDLVIYGSNEFLTPPDLSQAASANNEYFTLGYTDEADGVSYSTTPFNPSGAKSKQFNVDTTGVRWIFVAIENFADGSVNRCDVDLFSNFN